MPSIVNNTHPVISRYAETNETQSREEKNTAKNAYMFPEIISQIYRRYIIEIF